MAGETFIGSSGLWASTAGLTASFTELGKESEKNNGANQLLIEGTAAICPLSSLERIRQSLQSPLASARSSQSALYQVLCYLYSFLPISPQGKT